MRKAFFILIFISLTLRTLAQDVGNVVDEVLADVAEAGDEESEETAEMDYEYWENLVETKVDINTDNINELRSLPLLNDIQIGDIIDYRKRYGDLESIGELKGILSLSPENIRRLSQFVTVNSASLCPQYTLRELLTKGSHSISSNNKFVFERQKAYIPDSMGNSKYNGGRMKWCVKYRYKFKDRIAWGITCEKDAGESLGFGDRRYGFDYYSMFLRIRKLGIVDNLILGDYIVRFGQGLMLGGGFSMGKSMSGGGAGGMQIREYGSVNENRFYRGAAATMKISNRLYVTTFASANLIDATCEGNVFHSLRTDGYHRSDRELANKDNLRECIGGLMGECRVGDFLFGAAAYYFNYDKTFVPRSQLRYASMYQCRDGVGASLSYRYAVRKVSFYGETAVDRHGNFSTINTADFQPAANYNLRLSYRNYSPHYQAFKALSFGQASRASNEEGLYAGLAAEPCKWLSIEAWTDVFMLPWAGAFNRMPSTGNESMARFDFHFNRRYDLIIRLKHKERNNSDLDDGITKTGYLRLNSVYKPSENVSLITCLQFSRAGGEDAVHGYLAYQDVKYEATTIPLKFSFRYALFSAPYDARIYAMESDVTGTFAIPGYFYDGQRVYMTLGYKVGKMTLQLKISQWHYFDRQRVSSGDSEIDGNRKTEMSMFFKYIF